jgi:hypothetical protein
VNGLVARWPRNAISIRDQATYNRAGAVAAPSLATADLAIRNVVVVESPNMFEAGSSRYSFDLAANAIAANAALTPALVTAFPAQITDATTAAAFDWTPTGTSALAAGGMTTFTGKLQTLGAIAPAISGTNYLGAAAPGGAKWWAGWTTYLRN